MTARPKVVFKTRNLTVVRVKGKTRQRLFAYLRDKVKIPVGLRDARILDDIANILPLAAWKTKFAASIKAATRDALGKLEKGARGSLKKRLSEMGDADRVGLLRKAARTRMIKKTRTAAVDRVDGLFREIDLWHEFEHAPKTSRAEQVEKKLLDRIAAHNGSGAAEKWEEKIHYARRAFTPGSSPKGLPPGEVGDLIAIVYSKKKNPQRIWVMMVGNAKGATNSVALASKGGWYNRLDDVVVEGEFLGQPDFDLERIPEFGLEIPGHGSFGTDQIRVGSRSTLRIGVVPPDMPQGARNSVESFANNKSKEEFLLWDSRISSKESREAADLLLNIIEQP
jgi:hypothetical protein